MRRVQEYGFSDLQEFSNISNNRIDDMIRDYMSRHGSTTVIITRFKRFLLQCK